MITERELNAVELSPTKKDFYQIWNELLDTADKISKRWSPASTNEADPGVVLLKVLTAIADKLNYNIDKNILEAFMPSATQEESMRKLCDMLGYSMKYYRSATTPLTITWSSAIKLDDNIKFVIPKFTVVTTIDEDLTYCTVKEVTFNSSLTTQAVEVIQGSMQECETNNGNIITMSNIDENNRYYLPETQIAENGIYVNSVNYQKNENEQLVAVEGEQWHNVNNLNTQNIGSLVFKFNYDSRKQLPYLQFPDDISAIINDGIYIKYIRTNGINGNTALRTLTKFQTIDDIQISDQLTSALDGASIEDYISITNQAIASNGANKETINDAYTNYKKTIGTFDTLVTCRDYMNKIYQMLKKDLDPDNSSDTTPLVSNIIVSDIRDDINRSITLCSFDEYGINYIDQSLDDGNDTDLINCFNLVLYPFTTVSGSNLKQEYVNSFKYNTSNLRDITNLLEDNKTLCHTYISPTDADIVCIKNYLRLNAKITTTYKISGSEEKAILSNIYRAIYANFNMRKLDFGEEIPYDSILKVIEEADNRIKNISLDEPEVYTKYCLANGNELSPEADQGKEAYNKLARRNIIAGRIPLFNYNTSFEPSLTEATYDDSAEPTIKPLYPESGGVHTDDKIVKLKSYYTPDTSSANLPITLNENEVIQFKLPNFKTTLTYPAYVNYYLHLNNLSDVIEKNTDYQLQDGEYLYINYTPASEQDGVEKEPVNEAYIKDTVIRFNFDCHDSEYVHNNGTRWSKKSGFHFIENNPEGMLTFGTSEQVEIREKVVVKLGGTNTQEIINVYWQRNDDNNESNNSDTIKFEFDDNNEYTLQEGEYFYYTDRNKLDFAYYGNGTKIINHGNLSLIKSKANDDISTEDIMTYGLAAAIPWITVQVNNTQYLELQEYQYITLTNGDMLKELKHIVTTTTTVDDEEITISSEVDLTQLTNEWVNCSAAKFKFSSSDTDDVLSNINVDNISWEVRSKLEFNMGPDTVQTLHEYDKIEIYLKGNTTNTPDYTLENQEDKGNLSLKANYDCIDSTDEKDVRIYKTNTDTGTLSEIDDFKIKTFKDEQFKNQAGLTLSMNNFGSSWTKLSFESTNAYDTTKPYTHLNISLPDNNFGLVMIYYISSGAEQQDQAYLECSNPLTIFNNNNAWWTGLKTGTKYNLREGINIIKISTSSTINIYADVTENDDQTKSFAGHDILVIGNLDIIEIGNEINTKINYNGFGLTSAYDQLLSDIKIIDPDLQFYYNVVIDNATSIDLNENNSDETLSNPYTWYNYNNINNKFVISEIDADYLPTGITIARSSRL